MTFKAIIAGLIIHLIIPFTGLLYFLSLMKQMKRDNIPKAPKIELFIIFSTYGGLLLVVCTTLFWKWSGMASLGSFYLILGAPVIMAVIAFLHRQDKINSKYHKWTYLSGLLYFVIAPIAFALLFLVSRN